MQWILRNRYTLRKDHSVEVIYSNGFYTYWISITYKRKEKEIKRKRILCPVEHLSLKCDTIFFTRKNFFYFFEKGIDKCVIVLYNDSND